MTTVLDDGEPNLTWAPLNGHWLSGKEVFAGWLFGASEARRIPQYPRLRVVVAVEQSASHDR